MVGVVASLGVFFLSHTVVLQAPDGARSVDLPALAILLLAGWALARWRLGVPAVIGLCAALGAATLALR